MAAGDDDVWEVIWCKDSWHDLADRVRERLPSWARLTVMDESRPLASQVASARVLIPTTGVVSADVIRAAPRLQLITQPASGYNNIDLAQATAQGVPVCIAPGVNAQSVAEQALLMMLMLARKADAQRATFAERRIGEPPGVLLSGKRLGVIGLGAIGRCLEQAARGLGMTVVGVTSDSSRHELEQLLSTSHVVSIHTPVTSKTLGLIGAQELALMRPGALLLNLSRGEVVQKQALLDALGGGRLGGVGLDVHWEEPADPADPIYQHPKVLAMPHNGVCCEEVYDAYANLLVANIVGRRDGKALQFELPLCGASSNSKAG